MARSHLISLFSVIILATFAAWVAGPYHPALKFGSVTRDLNLKLGLDLQGGSHLVYQADVEGIPTEVTTEALAGVRDVIERRVNAFGVSEPLVQTNTVGDEFRIIIELAGVHDTSEAIRLIGETPQLDFRREIPTTDEEQFNSDDTFGAGSVFERTELSGKHLKRSTVSFDQVTGTPQVNLEFNNEGSQLFAELTQESIGQRIAIYLDGVPISAPVVQTEITNGQALISGGFALDEARQLAQRLNAGALPIPIELLSQQTVGPTLGQRSVQQSFLAGTVGLLIVIAWMIFFYRLPGVIAAITLVLYVVFFVSLLKLIPVTLTLAGVAGAILSVGMAVDANVLIFERFRENIRAGKTIGYSLEHGFEEAWNSIKASNISSLLIALILYGFGTSIIRGFALTFGLGILLSMFTAIIITRTLLEISLGWPNFQKPFFLGAKATNKP